nr:hypothetical protein [Kibdelosporangium aridum]
MTAALPLLDPAQDDVVARIGAMLDPGFLAGAGWNSETEVLAPPPGHLLLSRGICQVPECGGRTESRGMCAGCNQRFRTSNLELDTFMQVPRGSDRKGQETLCLVPNCSRVRRQLNTGLCSNHNSQYHRRYKHLPVSEFVVQPRVKPHGDLGSACSRRRNTGNSVFCQPHSRQWALFREEQPNADRQEWARWTRPIISGHVVEMRGLPPRVLVELLFGLQSRCRQGISTHLSQLRSLVRYVREHAVASVFELPAQPSRTTGQLLTATLTALGCALSSPEQERRKDVWNLRVFGHRGELPFTSIKQRWLREAAKRWAAEDLPRRRGRHVNDTLRSRISSLARLSDSLDAQREDHGHAPACLGRRDIENFLNRMSTAWLSCKTPTRSAQLSGSPSAATSRGSSATYTTWGLPILESLPPIFPPPSSSGGRPTFPQKSSARGRAAPCPRPSCGSSMTPCRSWDRQTATISASRSRSSWTPGADRTRSSRSGSTAWTPTMTASTS